MDFSKKDLDVLSEKDFFFQKKQVTRKIISHLSQLLEKMKGVNEKRSPLFPDGTKLTGKISKGENYQDLPYFVLDYPRLFSRASVCAIRTMVWWGNDISITLHLQGEALEERRKKLSEKINDFDNYYICIHPRSPWNYHYGNDNYQKIGKIDDEKLSEIIYNKKFIKISNYISISRIKEMENFLLNSYRELLKLV